MVFSDEQMESLRSAMAKHIEAAGLGVARLNDPRPHGVGSVVVQSGPLTSPGFAPQKPYVTRFRLGKKPGPCWACGALTWATRDAQLGAHQCLMPHGRDERFARQHPKHNRHDRKRLGIPRPNHARGWDEEDEGR